MHPEAGGGAASPALNVTRSFSGRSWKFRETDPTSVREIQRRSGVSQTLAQLLFTRGVAAGDIDDYLHPSLKRLLPEPFLLRDMEKAVERAAQSVRRRDTIAIYGDYDVDGSCSAALLIEFLKDIGLAPRLYVPDRLREGYGPNAAALLGLKSDGAALVITVDCGATAHAPLAAARAAGLDVIVLDHHAVEVAAPAFAQVNPNQSGDSSGLGHLCAAGVSFLFAVALNRELRRSGWYAQNGIPEPDLRKSLDLVGLATVCDVVPLLGINRAFVRASLAQLSGQERAGIRALAAVARVEAPYSLHHCGFVFGPRINAGGRVGRCSLGAELLVAADAADATPIAELLELHNHERRAIEAVIVGEAIELAARRDDRPFVLLSADGWHPGVVGIAASRLKDRFHKPTFIVGFDKEIGRGSARSVPGIDIGALVRAGCEAGVLQAGGGHAMAAGFSVAPNRIDAFRDWLAAQFENCASEAAPGRDLWLDAVISPSGATPELAGEIDRAGPFGAGNAEPVLAACDVRLAYADIVGQKHVRLRLQGGDGGMLSAIAFRTADMPLGQALLRARGERIHAAGFLRANLWNGRTEMQLQLEDAAAAA